MSNELRLCPWLFPALGRFEQAGISGRLGHGWIISGPRGVGKLNLALVLADRILHRRSGQPPPQASPEEVLDLYSDVLAQDEIHPDLHLIRPEEGKASISVEQIRAMIADLALTSLAGGDKLIVINQADRMTREAANALLKSLEEPIGSAYLLLLADRRGRLPATVRSRCQQLVLRRPSAADAGSWLSSAREPFDLPMQVLHRMPPIRLAALVSEEDNRKEIKVLSRDFHALSSGSADPHSIAERWHKSDPELALDCLIDLLRGTIREQLVPGHTTRITDPTHFIMDNWTRISSIGGLFAGLRSAENLREQIGRGTNMDLALKSLLLGLEIADDKRLEV